MIKKHTDPLQKNDSPPLKENINIVNSDNVEELQKQIEKLEKEREDYLKGWQQERADILNYRRREEERVGGAIKFANQSLLRELINVLDNFDFTFSNLESIEESEENKPKNWEIMLKGIYLIKSNLERVVKKYGLLKIDSLGKTFDPNLHEAINYTSDKNLPPDIITEELQSGYSLEGRVIRPAKVVVNSPQEDKE